MTAKTITLRLNPQQRELLERTIAGGAASDLESLVRLALRESASAAAKENSDA